MCAECGWLQENTHHPSAIDKIRELETPRMRSEPELETVYDHPTFTKHLNNIELTEKGTAVFECQVEPSKDPSLRIGKNQILGGSTFILISKSQIGSSMRNLYQVEQSSYLL